MPCKKYFPEHVLLEMLDFVNQQIILKGEEPIAFDHDCREGILRHLQFAYQWRASWPPKGYSHLPDLYETI